MRAGKLSVTARGRLIGCGTNRDAGTFAFLSLYGRCFRAIAIVIVIVIKGRRGRINAQSVESAWRWPALVAIGTVNRGCSMKVHLTDCSDLCSAMWGVKLKERRSALRSTIVACAFALLVIVNVVPRAAAASHDDDLKALQKLDTDYQRAVEQNDTQTMARILAEDFILVLGDGQVSTKADLLKDAASGQTKYEHQVDSDRTIRVWGDAAVITAKLWAKGLEDGKQVDYYMWFSDTYVRTPNGWSYVFGQASLSLPRKPKRSAH
jgi:ketosteroid isomerase-like protein